MLNNEFHTLQKSGICDEGLGVGCDELITIHEEMQQGLLMDLE